MTLTADQIAAVTRSPPAAIVEAVEMHFVSGVQRYWGDAYPVVAGGVTWSPGDTILAPLQSALQAVGLSAATMTIELSGVSDDWARLVLSEWDDADGALVRTGGIFLDPVTRAPLTGGVIYTGAWRFADVSHTETAATFDDPPSIVVTLTLESIFRARRSPGNEYMTHAAQQAAYPIDPAPDTGLQYLVELERSRVSWPRP